MRLSIRKTPLARAFGRSLLLAWTIVCAGPGVATAQNLVLKEQISVQGNVVTLGDLFEDPGVARSIAVFRSPDLGTTGFVAARRIQTAASRHGLVWTNPGEIENVMVRRLAREISLEEITRVLRQALAGVMKAETEAAVELSISGTPKPLLVDARTTAQIVVKDVHYDARSGTFDATMSFEGAREKHDDHRFQGQVFESVETVVPLRSIERGDVIAAADLRTVRVQKSRLLARSMTRMSDIAGMEARRRLTAGRQIRKADIEQPRLVRRNDIVTIVYRVRGLMLQAQGRALEDGAKGHTISVRNTRSNQTIQAEVQGPKTVVVANGGHAVSPRSDTRSRHRTAAKNHIVR